MSGKIEMNNFGREDIKKLFAEALMNSHFLEQAYLAARKNLDIFEELTDADHYDMKGKIEDMRRIGFEHWDLISNPYLSGREKIRAVTQSGSIIPDDFTEKELKEAASKLSSMELESYISTESMNRQRYTKKEQLMKYLFDFSLYKLAINQVQSLIKISPELITNIESSFIFLRANLFTTPSAETIYFEKEKKLVKAIIFPGFESYTLEGKEQDLLGAFVITVHELMHLIISEILEDGLVVKRIPFDGFGGNVKSPRTDLTAAFHEGISVFIDQKIIMALDSEDVKSAAFLSDYIKRKENGESSDLIHEIGVELAEFFEAQGLEPEAIPPFIGHMREYFEDNADVDLAKGILYIKDQVRKVKK